MLQPKNFDRKSEIVTISAQLFKEKGYSAVTMRDIAQAIDIKAASLYNHIKSKQEILVLMIIQIAEEYTDTIRGSGEALLRVINDILDFSKIESGNLELDNLPFDLRHCIEDVLDMFSAKASQKGLDLVYQIDYKIPAQIVSDGYRLRQILLNLIGNAMKFTDRKSVV